MAVYQDDNGVWRVQTNGNNAYNGGTLAAAVAGGYALRLIDMSSREEQYDAIAAELKKRRYK